MEPFSNGQLEEVTAAREAESALRRLRRFEFLLVAITTVAAIGAMAFSGYNSTKNREVARVIRDCTTPGGKCYEENRRSALEYRNTIINKLDEIKNNILDAAQCQTLQLLQHRDANERAHQLNATQHRYSYIAPKAEAPIPIPQQLQDACKKFLEPHEGGTR